MEALRFTEPNSSMLWSPDDSFSYQLQFEDNQDVSSRIYKIMKKTSYFEQLKAIALEAILEEEIEELTLEDVVKTFEKKGIHDLLSNFVQRMLETNESRHIFCQQSLLEYRSTDLVKDFSYIEHCRNLWEDGICSELDSMVSELKRPYIRLRPIGAVNPFLVLRKNEPSLSQYQDNLLLAENDADRVMPNPSSGKTVVDEEGAKFLYDNEDLFDTLMSLRNPNLKLNASERIFGTLKLQIKCPSLREIRSTFEELNASYSHVGMDENYTREMNTCGIWHEEAEAVIAAGTMADARKYLRCGVVGSHRPALWRHALGLQPIETDLEIQEYEQLILKCHRLDLITDEMAMSDVQAVVDDPKYFVFEEELKEICLIFSRDSWVKKNSSYRIHRDMSVMDLEGMTDLSGVFPFAGLSIYNGPMCYLYRKKPMLYSVCRSAYARLWCRLNVISHDDGTLLHMCKTFENLLGEVCPELFLHLIRLGIQPLAIAFPWMHQAFIGLLEVDQLLILWDRLIGFMDLTILAVLAAAIFVNRYEQLMQCKSPIDVTIILSEASRLRVLPLLQLFLYSEK